jgi:hypothetical protein
MKQRRRIYYSAAQRSEIWDRWQAGEPMSSIGRRLDRESSSVFSVISPTGGIRPPARHRAKWALSLFEREEISSQGPANVSDDRLPPPTSFHQRNTFSVGFVNIRHHTRLGYFPPLDT